MTHSLWRSLSRPVPRGPGLPARSPHASLPRMSSRSSPWWSDRRWPPNQRQSRPGRPAAEQRPTWAREVFVPGNRHTLHQSTPSPWSIGWSWRRSDSPPRRTYWSSYCSYRCSHRSYRCSTWFSSSRVHVPVCPSSRGHHYSMGRSVIFEISFFVSPDNGGKGCWRGQSASAVFVLAFYEAVYGVSGLLWIGGELVCFLRVVPTVGCVVSRFRYTTK